MENSKVICKTDADILLEFRALENSGFAFKYAKKQDGGFQQYVNCNGKIFGPYDYVIFECTFNGKAEWKGQKGDIEFKYKNNGEYCKVEKIKEITQEEIDLLLSGVTVGELGAEIPEEEYNEDAHVLRLNRKHQEFFITYLLIMYLQDRF